MFTCLSKSKQLFEKKVFQSSIKIIGFVFVFFLILVSLFIIFPKYSFAQSCDPGYLCRNRAHALVCYEGYGGIWQECTGSQGTGNCCVPVTTTCTWGSWVDGVCGGSCSSTKRRQTRWVNPADCADTSRCETDDSCGGPGSTPIPDPTEIPTLPPPAPDITPFPQVTPYPCKQADRDGKDPNWPEFHSLRPYQASNPSTNPDPLASCEDANDLARYCANDIIIPDAVRILKRFVPPDYDEGEYFIVDDDVSTPQYCPYPCRGPGATCSSTFGDLSCSWCPGCPPASNEFSIEPAVCPPTGAGVCPIQCFMFDTGTGTGVKCDDPNCAACSFCIEDEPCVVDDFNGEEVCTFEVNREDQIAVDLSGAALPIMGNTELVTNFRDNLDSETLSDEGKVNEYVSWFLNGVIGRAEYGPVDPDTDEGKRKIIDFSGPIRKLQSWASQASEKNREADSAGGPRHNQIIGCKQGGQRVPCYGPESTGYERPTFVVRMDYFESNQAPLPHNYDTPKEFIRAYTRWVGGTHSDLFSYVPFTSTEDREGRFEIDEISVQPLQPNAIVYNVLVENQDPAELFFAHMQETSELAKYLQSTFAPQGDVIDNFAPSDVVLSTNPYCDTARIRTNPGDNLFATEISADVSYTACITCRFIIPDPENKPGRLCGLIGEGGAECVNSILLGGPPYCDTYYGQVDCYPGQHCCLNREDYPTNTRACDDLGIGGPFGDFTCIPKSYSCVYDTSIPCSSSGNYVCAFYNTAICGLPSPNPDDLYQACDAQFYITLDTNTYTPKAKEIWARMVAGPASIFRRIFPKIGEGRPIEGIYDMPTATRAVYRSLTGGPILAGSPGNLRSGANAEIYFPHIGGVHEYLLKCIQQTLRPQGLADESCLSGPPPSTIFGDEINCDQTAPDVNLQNTIGISAYYDLVVRWDDGHEGNHVWECYNDVVRRARAAGMNVPLTLWLWMHESGASNYTKYPGVEDFGAHEPSPVGFVAQIEEFFDRVRDYAPGSYGCDDPSFSHLKTWAYLYSSGSCDPVPNQLNEKFWKSLQDSYGWVTNGGCSLPTSPFGGCE